MIRLSVLCVSQVHSCRLLSSSPNVDAVLLKSSSLLSPRTAAVESKRPRNGEAVHPRASRRRRCSGGAGSAGQRQGAGCRAGLPAPALQGRFTASVPADSSSDLRLRCSLQGHWGRGAGVCQAKSAPAPRNPRGSECSRVLGQPGRGEHDASWRQGDIVASWFRLEHHFLTFNSLLIHSPCF